MHSNSLRRFIIIAVAVTCTILVVSYSFLLRFYLTRGLHIDSEFRLEAEARQYLDKWAITPTTPLPKTATITAYLGYEMLPSDIRAACPKEKLVPGDFMPLELDRPFYHIHTILRPDGRVVYFIFKFDKDQKPTPSSKQFFTFYFHLPIVIGVITISLIILLAAYLLKRLAHPVENLRNWAMQLEMENLEDDPPPLTYVELNQLAELFRSNLRRLNEGVIRERQFQQYASHELRTPIAILTNNLELMERLGIHEHPCFASSFARMEKTVKRMLHLTNTLLWVCGEAKTRLPDEILKLDSLISNVIEENSYLLIGKDIFLDIRMEPVVMQAPKTVVHIIFSNLIRNAFQHTTKGAVKIFLENGTCMIINDKNSENPQCEVGFGLGLQLTQQLTDHLGFSIEIIDEVDQYAVSVQFPFHQNRRESVGTSGRSSS